jgi:hypothetical protein
LLQDGDTENADEVITICTPNKQSMVKIRAAPLPTDVTSLLEAHTELLRAMDKHLHFKGGQQNQKVLTERTLKAI